MVTPAVSNPAPSLLDRLVIPQSGAWASAARGDAAKRLAAMGLPGRRDEYWRFARADDFATPEPAEAPILDMGGEAPVFTGLERMKITFEDGVFKGEMPDAPEGVEISRLAEATRADLHWAKDIYGVLEAAGQSPVARPFAALNTAYATDGLLIRVTGKVTLPLSLIYCHEDPRSDVCLHHVVRVEEGGELTLLENGPAAARLNTVLEVDLADGASFHHVRAQGRDHGRRAITHIFARLGKTSVFKSFTLTVNGAHTRNETVIDFTGDDGVAHVAGAAMGDGKMGAFTHDDTVFITHDAVNCESRQVYKKVLMNGAVGVFQGKILVKDGAQKTDGYQKSQALLLDGDSTFLAKPELEIYADDVACSHGSTSGGIDEEALFYLRSRGVDAETAQDLLVLAFLSDAMDEIEDAAITADIISRLEGWLARRRG